MTNATTTALPTDPEIIRARIASWDAEIAVRRAALTACPTSYLRQRSLNAAYSAREEYLDMLR